MKILGIDSSGMVATVAILDEKKIVAEYTVCHGRTHSETLLPMIDEVMKSAELTVNDMDAIAIAAGPGSFTGLRIGAATAKGLALSIDKPIIPVKTCEGLAFNLWGASGLVCPIIDARRDQVYTGLYHVLGNIDIVMDQTPMAVEELVSKINELGEEVTFLGDGVDVYQEIIWKNIQVPCKFAPASVNRQRGASVATRAEILYNEGVYLHADDFAPEYLRKSQAERVKESGS